MNFDQTSIAALRRAQAALKLVEPPAGDLAHYSLAGAIRYALGGCADAGDNAFEAICDDEFLRAGFRKHAGRNSVFVPSAAITRNLVGRGMRALYQTSGNGGELVETTFRGDLFVDALRPRSRVLRLGAQTVGGLTGDLQIPRMDTTSAGYWIGESQSITEWEGSFDSSPLTAAPSVVGALVKISRKLLQQAKSNLAETIISNDLTRVLATALDAAAIAGTGTANQPVGVTNTSGVNTASGASWALATQVSALESICNANAIVDPTSLGWVTTPTVAALLSNRFEAASDVNRLWRGDVDSGFIDSVPALSTTNCPAATAVLGDWSQVLILSWGDGSPIEIEVSQFGDGFFTGDVMIRALLSCDIVVRHPASFTVVSGIT